MSPTWRDPYERERENATGLGTGSYGGIDERFKRRKRKRPIGFVPPQEKAKAPAKRGKA